MLKDRQRQMEIREKGFNMMDDFAKIKVGYRTLDDLTFTIGDYQRVNRQYGDKVYILNAISKGDPNQLQDISSFYYKTSGMYYRLCRYLAYLYRYDWYVSTFMISDTQADRTKATRDFAKVLDYLDQSNVKKICGDAALEIVKSGSYYACLLDFGDKFVLQQLPSRYCRSRYNSGTSPVVELNMRFFDACFPSAQQRIKMLKMMPKEIQEGYVLYKKGYLKGDYPGDSAGWFALDPGTSIKFSLNSGSDSDFPPFIGVIPYIIDLDQAQDLDRKKTMQQLLKIIVQKLPRDKNGDLLFDVDEAKDIHNNAVAMLKRAVGIDVFTTFADVEAINTRDADSNTSKDDLEKVERAVYNNSGTSQNLFNASGNVATTNSILNDESSFRDLILQFQIFINKVISKFNRKNHYTFQFSILETTQYNYQALSKLYKEQTQIGFSKMLPQIALGHSQSSILATAQFENEVLELSTIMVPPASSNTMSGKNLLDIKNQSNTSNSQSQQTDSSSSGRPEKDDTEKSDKTLANRESMG